MRKTDFQIDGVPGMYRGYTDDQHWNGFECPSFNIFQARKLLDAMAEGGGFEYKFNNRNRGFQVKFEDDDDWDLYLPHDIIDENGRALSVWSIGAFGWCWSEA